MEQRPNAATMKDATMKQEKEEFVFNMEQHGLKKTAAMKDAPIEPSREEFVFGMGQRKDDKYAIMKDAPNMPGVVEEFV